MEVYIEGKRFRLDPAHAVGKGGEADIFKIAPDLVVKVYKQPDHPDIVGNKFEMDAAKVRLRIHQKKLPRFPKNLPDRVVTPLDMATDKAGSEILGYTMRFVSGAEVLLRYSERTFRQNLIDNNEIAKIFIDLHGTISGVHHADVVIGDFNDLNIMVRGTEAYLIDADSFQFESYICTVYTERFVDPLLCDRKETRPVLAKPHTMDSDWYAYNVMLFRSLLYCDPYGGVYKPSGKTNVLHTERPLKRITVFHKDVRYPKPSIPYDMLPDRMLQHFHLVFEKDERTEFPARMLQDFRWTACVDCKTEHGRDVCPVCKRASPAAVKQVIQVRGKVTSTRIFRTEGRIVYATVQGGTLHWLYEDPRDLRREDGSLVIEENAPQKLRYRISGPRSIVALKNALNVCNQDRSREVIYTDLYGNMPVFDANEKRIYWVDSGILMREGEFGPDRIGNVLQNQTLFWVGSKFGFGFYRAGDLSMAFVFDAEKGGLNDTVKLPSLKGHMTDAVCQFAGDFCWFLVSLRHGGKTLNRCHLIGRDGTIEATAEAEEGDGSWLGHIRGKCAGTNFLLSVTDDGIVRVSSQMRTLVKTAEFPDTEPFVDAGCHLFPGREGIYVTDQKEVRLLKIK